MTSSSNQLPTIKESICQQSISDSDEKDIDHFKQLIHINSNASTLNSDKANVDLSFSKWYLSNKILNESEERHTFMDHLKEEFIRINSLVTDANTISEEMHRQIVYSVILQIPVSYLKPSERSINNLCLPAVQVKRENSVSQIWTAEKFECQFSHIKSLYLKWIVSDNKTEFLTQELKRNNPFFDEQFNSFIGVANIYLKSLFYNSKLDYIVPIIDTKGEMCGSLHVVMDQTGLLPIEKFSQLQINTTTCSSKPEGVSADSDEANLTNNSSNDQCLEDEGIEHPSTLSNSQNNELIVKFSIQEARDLPKSTAEYVMCHYTFINPKLDQTVISQKASDNDDEQKSCTFSFNHENEYRFPITDQFLSTCFESVVSIEVWHQHNATPQSIDLTENAQLDQNTNLVREITQQWKDVKRHIQFSVEIHELDSTGVWKPVPVNPEEEASSGGIYRLKQGQSKRVVVKLRLIPRPDPMPLVLHEIRSVEIGSISTRKMQAPLQLDSYQDDHLQCLRDKWLNFIEKRKIYLESQINTLHQKTNKTSIDTHRESIILEELVRLAEEHHIAMFPPASSGIPGSPACWIPPTTIEMHRPIIFLDIDPLDKSKLNSIVGLQAALIEENKTPMFALPLIQNASDQICAIAQWDPTIHELATMNQVTAHDTLIYLIVKITVIVSQPAHMELVLRKRIAINIHKPEEWWPEKALKTLLGTKVHRGTSVVYEIVSQIPKNLHDIENRKQIDFRCLSNEYIEKYIQYGSNIDSNLLLDKLRQEVLLEANSEKEKIVRKSTSVPNIARQKRYSNALSSPGNSRRNHLLNIPSETMLSLSQSELNSSTPSMISRSLFIEEEQLQSTQTSRLQIKNTIDLDDNRQQETANIVEQISTLLSSQSSNVSSRQIDNDHEDEDFIVGSRVIVNTGHSIFNKPGTIRFMGEICISTGIWYGIELDEAVGKNNGSLNGHFYFECPNQHGAFVRRHKIHLMN
ncbi:unnamed protein product [Rotaria socialis]|uniref:CAP-Gly domain-containing protein n=1 Tax=Rotaria socialis TaxID=392032 RepID=A0A820U396_9BILA|nr:unnamed protein product [Rotaria socialis]CAF4475691.1 unnamed protein product [Rotaria socialis]